MDFKGKVAIVTGGAAGIGKAIASMLLTNGLKVCICDVNEPAAKSFLQELPTELKPYLIFVKCDVSSEEEFRAVFEKTRSTFGKIDLLINNAGIVNEHNWKKTIDINFIGCVHGIKLGFEFMGTNNGGSGGFIINIASETGLIPFPFAPIYSATKHAVIGLTKGYGHPYHFEKTGITVNAVCPGSVHTQLHHTLPSFSVDKVKGQELHDSEKPMSTDEVAMAVMKVLQDGKNGSLLRIDKNGIRYAE